MTINLKFIPENGSGYVLDITSLDDNGLDSLWLPLTRDELLALRDQIAVALDAGMLAERTAKFAPFGLVEGDKVALTPAFRQILARSRWGDTYGTRVWEQANDEGILEISFDLGNQSHLAEFVGIYNPRFGDSIFVQPVIAKAMKAAWTGQHEDGS